MELYPLNSSVSYSYTALEPFRYAKANGWKTLLVQIDPGPGGREDCGRRGGAGT